MPGPLTLFTPAGVLLWVSRFGDPINGTGNALARVPGIAQVTVFGAGQYAEACHTARPASVEATPNATPNGITARATDSA